MRARIVCMYVCVFVCSYAALKQFSCPVLRPFTKTCLKRRHSLVSTFTSFPLLTTVILCIYVNVRTLPPPRGFPPLNSFIQLYSNSICIVIIESFSYCWVYCFQCNQPEEAFVFIMNFTSTLLGASLRRGRRASNVSLTNAK